MATEPVQIKKKVQFAQITVYVTGLVRQDSIFKRIMYNYGTQLEKDSYLAAYQEILSKVVSLERKKDSITDADFGGLVALIYKHERLINEKFKSADLSNAAYRSRIFILCAFTPLRGMINSLRLGRDLVQTPKEDYITFMDRAIRKVSKLNPQEQTTSINELEAAIKKQFNL